MSEDFFAEMGFDASKIEAGAKKANASLDTVITKIRALTSVMERYNKTALTQAKLMGANKKVTSSLKELMAAQKKQVKLTKDVASTQKKSVSAAKALDKSTKNISASLKKLNSVESTYADGKAVGKKIRGIAQDGREYTNTLKAQRDGTVKSLATLKKYADTTADTAKAVGRLNSAVSNYRGTLASSRVTMKSFDDSGRLLSVGLKGVAKDGQAVTKTFKRLATGGVANTVRFSDAVKKASKATKSMSISWGSMFRMVGVQVAHQAISALTRALVESIKVAGDFSIKVAEIQTISQSSQLTTDKWSKGLIKLSNSFGVDLIDQAESAYQLLSNQVTKGADSFEFLSDANTLAAATVSTSAEAVNILTATINAFKLDTKDTKDIAASFFKTVELGRIRLSELATTFGRVAIPASQLGISLNELQASLAVTTIKGVPAAEGMTFIRNIMLKLIRPTTKMKELFADLGVTSGEAAIKLFGFPGVLKILADKAKGSTTELGKLFGRIRAITGAMVFAGTGVEDFNKALKSIQNSGKSYAKAIDIVMESLGKRFIIQLTKIKNYLITDFGKTFLQETLRVTGWVGGLANTVQSAIETIKLSFIGMIGAMSAALYRFAALNPMIILAAGIVTATVALKQYYRALDAAKEKMEKLKKERISGADEYSNKIANGLISTVQNSTNALNTLGAKSFKVLSDSAKTIKEELIILSREFDRGVKSSIDLLDSKISNLKRNLEDIASKIALIDSSVSSLQAESKQVNLKFDLDSTDLIGKVKRITTEIKSEKLVRLNLFNEGNLKLGLESSSRIRSLILQRGELLKSINEKNASANSNTKAAEEKINEIRKGYYERSSKLRTLASNTVKGSVRLAIRLRELQENTNKKIKEQLVILKSNIPISNLAVDTRKEYNKEIQNSIELVSELRKELKAQAEADRQSLATAGVRKILLEGEAKRFVKLHATNIDELKTVKDINNLIAERAKSSNSLLEMGKKIGIDAKELFNLDAYSKDDRKEREIALAKLKQKNLRDQNTAEADNFNKSIKRLKELSSEAQKLSEKDKVGIEGGANLDKQAYKAFFAISGINFNDPKFKALKRLQESIKSNVATGADLKEARSFIEDALAKLNTLPSNLMPADMIDSKQVNEARQTIADTLSAIISVAENTANAESAISGIEKLQKSFAETSKEISENTVDMSKKLLTYPQALDAATQALKRFTAARQEYLKAIKSVAPDQTKVGTYSNGGSVGTDSIQALLSPGEFVVNAKATKKFYSQLLTMNSGMPKYSNGGTVTNVGDININANSTGNTTMDILKIGRGLQQEIRRGRLVL